MARCHTWCVLAPPFPVQLREAALESLAHMVSWKILVRKQHLGFSLWFPSLWGALSARVFAEETVGKGVMRAEDFDEDGWLESISFKRWEEPVEP